MNNQKPTYYLLPINSDKSLGLIEYIPSEELHPVLVIQDPNEGWIEAQIPTPDLRVLLSNYGLSMNA